MVEAYLDEHVDIMQAFIANSASHPSKDTNKSWRMITGHPNLCREQFRVPGYLFTGLVQLMCSGHFIKVAEQVGICLYILSREVSYRETTERFQHSISTISKFFLEALEVLVMLSIDVIRPYHSLEEVSPEISNNGHYYRFFQVYNFVIMRKLLNSHTFFINLHPLKELIQVLVFILELCWSIRWTTYSSCSIRQE
ncbi:hypothetical protein Cgig2_004887 [Carnegiea gigantea]|uniref:DUF8040 domain-containing protein n=1 Tax=Carnegiea gigantea TaxID=171969 RepID=A0A9Q1JRK2_9CARY|nr:hypothetical protein Cgig2_004887 [Carnegiea gigantea]